MPIARHNGTPEEEAQYAAKLRKDHKEKLDRAATENSRRQIQGHLDARNRLKRKLLARKERPTQCTEQ